jgi:hypothetical protein
MAITLERDAASGPVTLDAIMRESLGIGLRERYRPEREVPHGLLVLLMQMNEDKERARRAQSQLRQSAASA